MNRRARRAAASRGEADAEGLSEDKYIRICEHMARAMRVFLLAYHPEQPRFALPPVRHGFAVAPLDAVADKVSLNAEARALVDEFCRIGVNALGPGAQPTLEMLRAVLAFVGYPHEERPLEHFGQFAAVDSRGSSASN